MGEIRKNNLDGIAKTLLLPINPSAVIILGIYTILWGFWLANPFWDVFSQAALYAKMANLAPEVAWGLFAMVAGGITTRGAITRKYRHLTIGSTTAAWHWLLVAVFYFWADPLNTGGITSLMLTVYAAFIYLNIRVNFKDRREDEGILSP